MPLGIHIWRHQGYNLNYLSRSLLDELQPNIKRLGSEDIYSFFPYMDYVKRLTPWAGPLLTSGLLFQQSW